MFNVWNGLTNGTRAVRVPIFQVTTNFVTTVHVDGGVRTTADGIVTQNHNRWDRSTPDDAVGVAYVFRHHTMAIFIRDGKRGVDLSGDVSRFSRTAATFFES